jgi:hypothetical protein
MALLWMESFDWPAAQADLYRRGFSAGVSGSDTTVAVSFVTGAFGSGMASPHRVVRGRF